MYLFNLAENSHCPLHRNISGLPLEGIPTEAHYHIAGGDQNYMANHIFYGVGVILLQQNRDILIAYRLMFLNFV